MSGLAVPRVVEREEGQVGAGLGAILVAGVGCLVLPQRHPVASSLCRKPSGGWTGSPMAVPPGDQCKGGAAGSCKQPAPRCSDSRPSCPCLYLELLPVERQVLGFKASVVTIQSFLTQPRCLRHPLGCIPDSPWQEPCDHMLGRD